QRNFMTITSDVMKKPVFPSVSALIVDDEEMNIAVAKGILTGYRMRIDYALSGKDAIEKCKSNYYDLIFMDHMMPEMDGVEAVSNIRKIEGRRGEASIIIALTANAVSGSREMFLNSGFDGFVAKPINKREMERLIVRLLPVSKVEYEYIADDKERELESSKELVYEEDKGLQNCMGDKDLYKEICFSFIDESVSITETLDKAYHAGDTFMYRERVRGLKNISEIIGFPQMTYECQKADKMYLDSDMIPPHERHERLVAMCREAVDLLNEHYKEEA
nr:response regulator [Lachnospiraceae bacterium]